MKKYHSEALKVIHQDAEGLHRLGIISDKEMREYDRDCLVKEPETSYAAEKSGKTEYAATAR
jgi:DNA-binding transcriptional regulator YiaG